MASDDIYLLTSYDMPHILYMLYVHYPTQFLQEPLRSISVIPILKGRTPKLEKSPETRPQGGSGRVRTEASVWISVLPLSLR